MGELGILALPFLPLTSETGILSLSTLTARPISALNNGFITLLLLPLQSGFSHLDLTHMLRTSTNFDFLPVLLRVPHCLHSLL